MKFRALNESAFKDSALSAQQSMDLFYDRFGGSFESFWDAFQRQSQIKYGNLNDDHAYEFINMIDSAEQRFGKINRCQYDAGINKITFLNSDGVPVAECDCKNGWVATPMPRKDKFNLTEELNGKNQISISFPLLVTYECEDDEATKDDIEDYQELEEKCIQTYADEVIERCKENQKYIDDILGVYDSTLEYDGYDDNFNVFFLLTTERDDIVDEVILKALKRYFNDTTYTQEDTNIGRVLMTATPVATLNSSFSFERLE